jgi:hypothetical protein
VGQAKRFSAEIAQGVKRAKTTMKQLALQGLRYELDEMVRIAHLIPGKQGDPGRTGNDNRLFVDAIVWMGRTGTPWRDLPPFFGKWNSVWKRFRRWTKAGVAKHAMKPSSPSCLKCSAWMPSK